MPSPACLRIDSATPKPCTNAAHSAGLQVAQLQETEVLNAGCSNGDANNNDDTVASLAILSNPQMINGTSVLFPVVSNIDSDSNKPSDVAAYYRTNSVVSIL